MKRILAAVDGSESSLKAVDAAANIAGAVGAELSLLAVVPSAGGIGEELKHYARTEHILDRLPSLLASIHPEFLEAAEAQARAKGATAVSLATATGEPASDILSTAREKDVDLIVLGSRGRGRLSGLLLGSVSQKVATYAPCSVLIVR